MNVMLDLETWGRGPGCQIRSIGAVFFDKRGLGAEFYANVDCSGFPSLTKDPGTEAWWSKQEEAAQAVLLTDVRPMDKALAGFRNWWKINRGQQVWCNGATFDAPIMEKCFHAVDQDAPWAWWNVRCYRTLKELAKQRQLAEHPFEGTKHHALHDAKHQALNAILVLKDLRVW